MFDRAIAIACAPPSPMLPCLYENFRASRGIVTDTNHDHPRAVPLQNLQNPRQRHRPQGHFAGRLRGQGAPYRQRGFQVRLYSAIHRPPVRLREIQGQGPRYSRVPLQPVWLAGAGHGRRDQAVLFQQIQRHFPAVRQDRREWPQSPSALHGVGGQRLAVSRRHQMEFHQVPHRPRRRHPQTV